jgi:hypothetical protein
MTIQLLLHALGVCVAVGTPVTLVFLIGTAHGAENAKWKQFRKFWCEVTVVGFAGPPLTLWKFQNDFFPSWWLAIGALSMTLSFFAFAVGARLANPAYRPNGKDPLGMALELATIIAVSAAAGLAWRLLPGGNQSWAALAILLTGFVVYIFFMYDAPKGIWKVDRGLLCTSYLIEVAALVLALVLWLLGAAAWVVVTGILGLFLGPTGISKFLWQEGLPGWIFLALWVLVNLAFWIMSREPQGIAYPDHVFPRV